MQLVVLPSLAVVPQSAWDDLVDGDNPFVEHAFLRGLEVSSTVGEATGWHPMYVLVTDPFESSDVEQWPEGVRIHGAAPAYLKSDSYGEFIFDWAWAEFYRRNGLDYYPKLVVAVPFTPVTGPRMLLVADGPERAEVERMLAQGLIELARRTGCSTVHWLFTPSEQAERLAELGYLHRFSQQHVWHNRGYADFDAFLATMRSRSRKQIRRERRLARGHGLELSVVRGEQMDDRQWQAIDRMYRLGCAAYGSRTYLTPAFFDWLRGEFSERVLCTFAADSNGEIVAGTLNFRKGLRIYGRYWGCTGHYDHLHFELAYYLLIEHCIAEGLEQLEAGAGGQHKVRRGFEPRRTHSAHHIVHRQISPVLERFIASEREHTDAYIAELHHHGTSRRGPLQSVRSGGGDPPER
jgi:hypothetical protein